MTIVQKVISLLNTNKKMSLKEIYESLPEHSHASIRGNINRYLKKNDEPAFERSGTGIYSVIEIISVRKTDSGTEVDYSASYYNGEKEIHLYHTNVKTCENLSEGIYSHMEQFSSFEELENHTQSVRGIFESGDAIEIMRHCQDQSFDLLLTDPPYRVISGGAGGKGAPKGMLSKNDGKIFDFNNVNLKDWLTEAYRLLKDGSQAYVFTNFLNLQDVMATMQEVGFKLHNLLVWQKNNATPNRWYMKNCEYVVFARKGKAKAIKNCGSMTVHKFDNIIGNKCHETEKPIDLLKYYIENSTSKDAWILDPFAGSGSTAVAALELGRKFFTIEIDPKYVGNIHNRLKDTISNLTVASTISA